MRSVIFTLAFICLFTGCKKAVEEKQMDLVVMAMTSGQWVVTSFTIQGADRTSDFLGYRFQYHADGKVDAIKNSSVEKTGMWAGDAVKRTTYANFAGATNPLELLNGTWQIDDNSWTYVKASMAIGSETRTLRLDKQ